RARLAAPPSTPAALASLFVHRHLVDDGGELWGHTHGMEQLGLPDLECRVPPTAREAAIRLLDLAVARFATDGCAPAPGDRFTLGDGERTMHGHAAAATIAADHPWGAYGALRLSLAPAT